VVLRVENVLSRTGGGIGAAKDFRGLRDSVTWLTGKERQPEKNPEDNEGYFLNVT
jgi:hypothetical protein